MIDDIEKCFFVFNGFEAIKKNGIFLILVLPFLPYDSVIVNIVTQKFYIFANNP